MGAGVIRWDRDEHGIVTLTMDDPEQRVNTLNGAFVAAFAEAVDRLEAEREHITGVIMRSAKPSFLAGGDLNRLMVVDVAGREPFLADLEQRKSRTRRLEQLGRPVVALIEGAALGGGLELALACHHRVAVRSSRVHLGLPEVTLGLLPGGGGLVRTTRLLGGEVCRALALSGIRLDVDDAHEIGLVDQVVPTAEEAERAARAWIAGHPAAVQPWDAPDSRPLPDTSVGRRLVAAPVAQPDRALAPAAATISALVATAEKCDLDVALSRESEGLADLVVSAVAKRTIQVTFFDTVAHRARVRRNGDRGTEAPVLVASTPAARGAVVAAGLERFTAPDGGGPRLDVLDHDVTSARGLWVSRDRLGDGGFVLELALEDHEYADCAAHLSGSGALVIRVDGSRPGLADRMMSAVADAARDLLDPDRALTAAGMKRMPVTEVPEPADPKTLEAARSLVEVAAAAAREAADSGVLVETGTLDVASVRLGLPAWTGGAERLRGAEVNLA